MLKKLRFLLLSMALDARTVRLRRLVNEAWRVLRFKKHEVHVFLQLDDPYSYLLAHFLERLQPRYPTVVFRYYLCQGLRGDFTPQPAMQAKYALADCRLLAAELGVPFLDTGDQPLAEFRRPLLDFLAGEMLDEDFPATFSKALAAYWRGDRDAALHIVGRIGPEDDSTRVLIGRNQLLLRKLGHYSCATMYYGGEWYFGTDRLAYLAERLDGLKLNRGDDGEAELTTLSASRELDLPEQLPPDAGRLPPLEMYHSFRSPYSFIALRRAFRLADAYGVRLVVRPVLPMVQRGLKVPKSKLLYIVRDASREAQRLGVPFDRISDTVGEGAERCIAAFAYAESQGRGRQFLQAAGEAAWVLGIDLASDEGMQAAAGRAGLDWPKLQKALADDAWRKSAEANREAMTALGLWGVPSFSMGNLAVWGQDRLWLLARKIGRAVKARQKGADG